MADPRPWDTVVDVAVSIQFGRFHQCSPVARAWQSSLAWILTQQCNMLETNVGSITFSTAKVRLRRPPEARRALQPPPMCQIRDERLFVPGKPTNKRRFCGITLPRGSIGRFIARYMIYTPNCKMPEAVLHLIQRSCNLAEDVTHLPG